jgi:AcrR family transcriptional regulator
MPARGRPAGFDRNAALKSAMLLFWKKGYHGTAMSDLVTHMGIQSASIYSAFGSKEKLFDEALGLYVETVGQQIWGSLEEHERARVAIESMLKASARLMDSGAGPGGCLITLGAIEGGGSDVVIAKLRAMRHGANRMIAARIEQAIREGEIASTTQVDRVASFYTAIQQSIALRARDGDTPSQLAQLVESAMCAWPVLTDTAQ